MKWYVMSYIKNSLLILVGVLICGCTVLDVRPVHSTANLTHVAIVRNPKVKINNFTSVLRNGFERHGISTEMYSGYRGIPESSCIVTYTALRSWDIMPYMNFAEVSLRKDNKQIGYGEFRLRGDGGLSLFKWCGTGYKLDPLMDELLRNYPE